MKIEPSCRSCKKSYYSASIEKPTIDFDILHSHNWQLFEFII